MGWLHWSCRVSVCPAHWHAPGKVAFGKLAAFVTHSCGKGPAPGVHGVGAVGLPQPSSMGTCSTFEFAEAVTLRLVTGAVPTLATDMTAPCGPPPSKARGRHCGRRATPSALSAAHLHRGCDEEGDLERCAAWPAQSHDRRRIVQGLHCGPGAARAPNCTQDAGDVSGCVPAAHSYCAHARTELENSTFPRTRPTGIVQLGDGQPGNPGAGGCNGESLSGRGPTGAHGATL